MKKTKNNILYISGKINDPDPKKQRRNLDRMFEVEQELLFKGYDVFNPAALEKENKGYSYEDYLADEILWIIEHRPILYMLKSWKDSFGARFEWEVGKRLGLTIIYE